DFLDKAVEVIDKVEEKINKFIEIIVKKEEEIIKRIRLIHHSEPTPVGEFIMHINENTSVINLTALVADVNTTSRKSILYMPSWPKEIEEYKVLYIPSTGVGRVYICRNATSLDEVNPSNADLNISVWETKDNITLIPVYFDGKEYYAVYGITNGGGGEYCLTEDLDGNNIVDIFDVVAGLEKLSRGEEIYNKECDAGSIKIDLFYLLRIMEELI
ncbi:MAG: hypothetical protein ACK4YO_03185, partial [Candidatus Altarchaeaceae archaeon]